MDTTTTTTTPVRNLNDYVATTKLRSYATEARAAKVAADAVVHVYGSAREGISTVVVRKVTDGVDRYVPVVLFHTARDQWGAIAIAQHCLVWG